MSAKFYYTAIEVTISSKIPGNWERNKNRMWEQKWLMEMFGKDQQEAL